MGDSPTFALVRYLSNGALDPTFGGIGIITTSITSERDLGYALAPQPDGKIVVAGTSSNVFSSTFTVARYLNDGQLDPTFNQTGIITTAIGNSASGRDVAIQADGKIVVAGSSERTFFDTDFALARYDSDGHLDLTFNGTGVVTTSLSEKDTAISVAIQPDGKILAAGFGSRGFGSHFTIVRYEPDGALDPTFNGTGVVTTSISGGDAAIAIALQPDGKIVAVGHRVANDTEQYFAMARYDSDGQLDTTFNQTGIVTTTDSPTLETAFAVAIQPDDKIVVVLDSFLTPKSYFTVARFLGSPTIGDRRIYLPAILKN